ncbi:MAG: hypothetical protein R2710_09770 [Acidimicrobiales bacterium]
MGGSQIEQFPGRFGQAVAASTPGGLLETDRRFVEHLGDQRRPSASTAARWSSSSDASFLA